MKTFTVIIDPGNSVQVVDGFFAIRMITDSSPHTPQNNGAFTNSKLTFSMDISGSDYYYVRIDVSNYTLNNDPYHVSDYASNTGRFLPLLATFDASVDTIYVTLQSTVATVFTFSRMLIIDSDRGFWQDIAIQGSTRAIATAYGMKNNFWLTEGGVSSVIKNSPNELETNSYPLFNFLSTLLYYCLTDQSVYESFLSLASINGRQCSTAVQALLNLSRYPFTNVQAIYDLISDKPQIFTPSLTTLTKPLPRDISPVPNQWTLTIKVNNSGSKNFIPAGLAYVVFDKEGKAWVANNFRAGSGNSGTHCLVFNPDGSPASISPIFGAGLLGAAFGAAIDPTGEHIAIGNFGWGEEYNNPQYGSVSIFKYDGTPITPADGYVKGLSRVQGMCYDSAGNLWMASVGEQKPFAPGPIGVYEFESQPSACVVYLGGDPENVVSFSDFNNAPSPYNSAFDVAIHPDGDAVVVTIGDTDNQVPSTVQKLRLQDGKLTSVAMWVSDHISRRTGKLGSEQLRQVAFDKDGNIFVVAIASSRVIKFDSNLKYIKEFTTNINAPWGIIFDGDGTMFVSNFGREKDLSDTGNSLDMKGPYGVSIIYNQDDSSTQLMTVPTSGNPVTLSNGLPLYGNNNVNKGKQMVSYEPIMRLTSSNIDVAGNLWAMNNWKPSALVDVANNPGGDGVVIYIGVAQPLDIN